MCLYFSHKDNSEREQLLSDLLLQKKEAKVWCVWSCFLLGCKKATEEKTGKREKLPFFCPTKPSRFVLQISFWQKWIIISQKKKKLEKLKRAVKRPPERTCFLLFWRERNLILPSKNHIKLWSFPFTLWELSQLNFAILRNKGMSEHNTLTHTKKDVMNCCEDNLSHHGKRVRKKTLISWWNLSIFPVTRKSWRGKDTQNHQIQCFSSQSRFSLPMENIFTTSLTLLKPWFGEVPNQSLDVDKQKPTKTNFWGKLFQWNHLIQKLNKRVDLNLSVDFFENLPLSQNFLTFFCSTHDYLIFANLSKIAWKNMPQLPNCVIFVSQVKKYMGSTALFSWGQKNLRYFVNTLRNFRKKYWDVTKQAVKSKKTSLVAHNESIIAFFCKLFWFPCETVGHQMCLWSVQLHILPQTPVRCSIIHKPCCDFGVQQILASVVQFSTLFFLDTLTNHSNLFFVSFSEDTYVNWCWCIWHSKQVLSFEWACSWSNHHQQTLFAASLKCKLRSRFV